MNRPALLALATLALTRAEAARAGGSCGGGGGGSAGGGGGGSGGTSPPVCRDDTDVVGHRRCPGFARWSSDGTPLLLLELGAAVRTFASPLREVTGELAHDREAFTYRVGARPGAAAAPPEAAVLATARLGLGLPRGLYLALEGELGELARADGRAAVISAGARGTPSMALRAGQVAGALAAAGVRGQAGRASLGVEIAGGVRSIAYLYESRYLACVTAAAHAVRSPIAEVRARASVWLSPFVSLGASAGASVLERGAWMAGVHLGFATHAYGNLRD